MSNNSTKGLKPCPMTHPVSAGLRTYKTERDPHVICLDCGLSLAAPSWETVYERWNSRADLAPVSQPPIAENNGELFQVTSRVLRWLYATMNPKLPIDKSLLKVTQFEIHKELEIAILNAHAAQVRARAAASLSEAQLVQEVGARSDAPLRQAGELKHG